MDLVAFKIDMSYILLLGKKGHFTFFHSCIVTHAGVMTWTHFLHYWLIWRETHRLLMDSPHKWLVLWNFNAFLWCWPEQPIKQEVESPMICHAITLICRHCNISAHAYRCWFVYLLSGDIFIMKMSIRYLTMKNLYVVYWTIIVKDGLCVSLVSPMCIRYDLVLWRDTQWIDRLQSKRENIFAVDLIPQYWEVHNHA